MSDNRQEASPLPLRTLYHYTTQQGLLGIIDSKSIWASVVHFLNDATEFRAALEVVAAELRTRVAELDSREGNARGEAILRELTALEETNVFVLSLTEEDDDLSQWRAYGGKHSGFALGFDIDKLHELASEHSFSLECCLYDSPAQGLLAATIVDEAMAWLSAGDRMDHRRRREFRRTMVRMAPLFKDYSFADEREWRLVSASHPLTMANIGFHAGPSTIVPHYRLPLFVTSGSSPLSSVTVGPTPHLDLAMQSARALLQARGFDIPVYESRIPLRTW
jgi:hypothetical protein